MGQMEYIRRKYGVPAKRGAEVLYLPPTGRELIEGRITSAKNGYIRIRFKGDQKTHPAPFHPVWNLQYVTD